MVPASGPRRGLRGTAAATAAAVAVAAAADECQKSAAKTCRATPFVHGSAIYHC